MSDQSDQENILDKLLAGINDLMDHAKSHDQKFDQLQNDQKDQKDRLEKLQKSVDGLDRSSTDQMRQLGDIKRDTDRVAHRVTSLETESTLHRHTASGRSSLHAVELVPDGGGLHAPQRRWRKLVRGRD